MLQAALDALEDSTTVLQSRSNKLQRQCCRATTVLATTVLLQQVATTVQQSTRHVPFATSFHSFCFTHNEYFPTEKYRAWAGALFARIRTGFCTQVSSVQICLQTGRSACSSQGKVHKTTARHARRTHRQRSTWPGVRMSPPQRRIPLVHHLSPLVPSSPCHHLFSKEALKWLRAECCKTTTVDRLRPHTLVA